MKKLLIVSPLLLVLAGCMMPNYSRLIPENKDADIFIVTPYGHATIRTRVPQAVAPLPPLPLTAPTAFPGLMQP